MVNRLFNPLIVRFAALAALAALLALVLAAPVAFAQDSSIPYPENGTDPVATFTAFDQDDDPIEWSRSGPDYKLFTIDGGVLAFKKSPDYEKPNSKSTGTIADRNVYNVTIKATGGEHDVAVSVTNVDEAGKVTLTKPQPQVGRGLEATLGDPDGGETDERWQWARSEDGETWADIEGATSQSRNPTADDEGSFLRASVTYADSFGNGKTAMAVSENRVEGRTVANAAPSFSDQDEDDESRIYVDVSRSVGENTDVGGNVGKPVSATDADSDVLLYSLRDSPDLKDGDKARFTIDPRSGQIKVGKKLGADAGQSGTTMEEREDVLTSATDDLGVAADAVPADLTTAIEAQNSMYVLIVRATDPSGAFKDVNVVVTVAELPEAPAFNGGDETADPATPSPTTLYVTEGARALRTGKTATTDPSNALADAAYAATDDDNEAITYSVVEPDDEDFFGISATGQLTINATHEPDFEKQASYPITIVATSGMGDDARTTRLSVTVKVTDAEDAGKVELSQLEPQVGRTVVASLTDPDGGETVSAWQWYRNAEDATTVQDLIGAETGCATAGAGTLCPIEKAKSAAYTPTDDDDGARLAAMVTYTDNIPGDSHTDTPDPTNDDGNDDTPTTMDGIKFHAVTKEDVQPSKADNTAPLFPDQDPNTSGDQSDETSREIAENTKAKQSIGAPVSAVDDNGDAMLYTLGGSGADSFDISRSNGQISTKAELDYESKATYMVVVTATDPSGAADSILVTINVTDENDPAEIAGASAKDYAENGTDPVLTFTAMDQDDDPIKWSRSGPDYKLFTIDGGVLAFKKSPDYEKPNSKSTGTIADRNVYNVTIKATGGEHDVAVSVTNVDEAGKVTLTKPQPQVGRGLEATLGDPDGGETDERWQWARSEDGETWADIEGATSQSRNPTADDVGSFLRATVNYADSFGNGKTAMAVSENRVEGRTVANAAPSFSDQDEDDESRIYVDVSRSVGENTDVGGNVGKPVSATDGDSDVLLYSLRDSPDLEDDADKARFTIDPRSGQIKVGKKLGADAGQSGTTMEEREDVLTSATDDLGVAADAVPADLTTAIEAQNSMYVLIVRATDPSGAFKDVNVVVTVADLPEAPAFNGGDETADPATPSPTTLYVTEGARALRTGKTATTDPSNALADAAYAATDDDNEAITYSVVEPDDEDFFGISATGQLTINATHEPDFEKQASYPITIVATSGMGDDARTTRLSVTVKVTDAEDAGEVELSQLEPQVGSTVVASLTDPDGGETVSAWQWYRNAEDATTVQDLIGAETGCATAGAGTLCPIEKAKSAAYTPTDDDDGARLAAMVTYTDNIDSFDGEGTDTERVFKLTQEDVQPSKADNTAPLFPDQDPNTSGDQSDETSREIAENTKAKQSIGAPVDAVDEDGDLMLYTLGGSDADSFSISRSNGQLTTKAALDYESKATYMVVVTAMDPSGAADSILVTINVTDEDDAATITPVTDPVEPEEPENNAPEFAAATAARSVAENTAAGTAVGAPVTATDADDDTLIYTLSGSAYFAIDDSGQITTTMMLDHEDMASHTVTVMADDGNGGSDSIDVTIMVTDESLGGIADSYDANNDEMIDRDEASAAITDYLLHGTITQDEARAVVRAYLTSP